MQGFVRRAVLSALVLLAPLPTVGPLQAEVAATAETGGIFREDGGMAGTGTQDGLNSWIAGFRPRAIGAGIPAATFDAALREATYLPKVVERDRTQNEFTKTIWDYLDTAVSDDRVRNGRAAVADHAALLEKIEARYGVDRHILAAIWGLESAYGTYRGDIPVMSAMATLAYDGRRATFFESQLLAALRILETGEADLSDLRGSWAGAMGHTQFMPTSWLDVAVDFTGDGRRNIWGDDPADALASTAAYLAKAGWTTGQLWGLEVALPQGFDYDQTTERVKKPVADWQALGVRPMAGGELPDHGLASVLLPGGARGAAFLIFGNFQVIETYNTADAYIIAVGHLADRLRGGPPIAAGWPRDLRALTLDERMELQRRLTEAGFDAGGVDGRIGPLTIAAVKSFQKSAGLVPDGYPSLDLLIRLR